jgi:hypothetical protein
MQALSLLDEERQALRQQWAAFPHDQKGFR